MISYNLLKNKIPDETINLWMNHLLVIYAFFLPISNRATSAVFVIILILFLYRRNYLYYLKDSFKNPVVITLSLLFLIHIVWLLGTQNFDYAFRMLRNIEYALYPIIFLSFLYTSFSSKVVSSFILGMLFTEIVSYSISFGFLPEKLVLFERALYSTIQYDPTPFFSHIEYSTALAVVIALLVIIFTTKNLSSIFKLLTIFFIITATINLSIIGGRTGYLVFLIIIPLTFFLLYRKQFYKIIIPLFLSISIIGVLAYNYSPIFKDRIEKSKETLIDLHHDKGDYSSSFGQRLGTWNYSFEVIKENWLFGVGTGDHMDEIRKVIKTHKDLLLEISHPHNQLVSYTVQFGLFGFILYLSLFYQIFKYNYETLHKKRIAFIITTAVGVALMLGDFNGAFYLPVWMTLLSACFATRVSVQEDSTKNLKIAISYFAIIFLVSLNVYFQISI